MVLSRSSFRLLTDWLTFHTLIDCFSSFHDILHSTTIQFESGDRHLGNAGESLVHLLLSLLLGDAILLGNFVGKSFFVALDFLEILGCEFVELGAESGFGVLESVSHVVGWLKML